MCLPTEPRNKGRRAKLDGYLQAHSKAQSPLVQCPLRVCRSATTKGGAAGRPAADARLAVLERAEALAARGGARAGGLQVQALEGRGGGVKVEALDAPAGALQAHVVEPRDGQACAHAGLLVTVAISTRLPPRRRCM